jgi:hypothetical protein
MASKKPFTQEALNEIFKISSIKKDQIISRESSVLEFKESFGWNSLPKYMKTSAAFANARGGYIVFGIANRPHKMVGLSGQRLAVFEQIDSEKMSRNLNDYFAPEISWEMQEYELGGKIFGLLFIHESLDKPVVCTKYHDKGLREGDIYYRYRGRTERIKYSELKSILEGKREAERKLWMRHVQNIARIGVREAGIFNLKTGEVKGTNGSFLIDESLLSQLSFIKEGEFSEVKGKPTLKLLGNLRPIDDVPSAVGRQKMVKI